MVYSHSTESSLASWHKLVISLRETGKAENRYTELVRLSPPGQRSSLTMLGLAFEDENLDIELDSVGLLAMANRGPDTNSSQL